MMDKIFLFLHCLYDQLDSLADKFGKVPSFLAMISLFLLMLSIWFSVR